MTVCKHLTDVILIKYKNDLQICSELEMTGMELQLEKTIISAWAFAKYAKTSFFRGRFQSVLKNQNVVQFH